MKIYILILVTFIASCSHVNEDSRLEYDKQNSFRHGIVPIELDQIKEKVIQVKLDQKAVSRGQVLYKAKCYSCHGASGTGDGPLSSQQDIKVKNISKLAKEIPRFKFFMLLSSWKGQMPGWKEVLSDKEISDIEAYIVHLSRLN